LHWLRHFAGSPTTDLQNLWREQLEELAKTLTERAPTEKYQADVDPLPVEGEFEEKAH
jgi:hypothetical protein